MKNILLSVIVLSILTVLSFIMSPVTRPYSTKSENNALVQSDIPTNTPTPIPTEIDNHDIVVKTIRMACEIETQAAATFDMTDFPKVFVNDPRFPVGPQILEYLRDVTDNPSLEQAGYLDHMLTYFGRWRDGALHLEAIWEKMEAEGRDEMTAEEMASLVDEKGRIVAPRARLEDWGEIDCTPNILSMEISKDIATIVINDGPTTSEMYLVKSDDGQWYIAGRKVLRIHP